ncbi:hypothetical protein DCE79_14360 [Lysinibacillus sp. 2017]|uniref:hypothetical protein n=1 Tax=unclassified Lysinibacillus TaxID=2636778 RepID=UPI000D527342|nr:MULTISPECIES: hypothetical protein [unclassified Lysinibacillus]AWE08477.1 hypothetical protein DCE79_14360 [Lysinibacillus sp. 2017]TGN34965.1 hypothetical protein E4L99_12360 [Lysinibacillus sp. S2017]
MTNSQVKQAIDETIGKKPMLNESFVEKVLTKKRPPKRIPLLQPAIVFVLMLAISAILYLTPSQNENSAVEIKEQYLTDGQKQLMEQYYSAIAKKDKKALREVATLSTDEVITRYKVFDLTKALEVVKTIDADNELTLFVKLQSATERYVYLEKLVLDKPSNKFVLSDAYEFSYYNQKIELPKTISLNYKTAPIATPMTSNDIDLDQAEKERINGNTFYQLETKLGMKRIFEAFSGERFDLGIVSEGMSYFSAGHDNQFYFIDALTMHMTFIYLNDEGNYQIMTGELGERSITTYQTDVLEEPILITVGEQPKIMTIQQGQLVYADIFEQAELDNPRIFYTTEASMGSHVVVKYTEDLQQISTDYKFTASNVLTDSRTIDMFEAKPEHLQEMVLQNRRNSQIIYIFANGTLHYKSDTRLYYEKPKSADEKPASGELIEEQYTNIQIKTKNNQYFITGDKGFSWTLTRTGPRILQDEKGIEYTIPIAFEDLPEISNILLEDEIQSLRIYKINGYGTNSYVLEEDIKGINELFANSAVNKDFVSLEKSELMIEIEYHNGKKEKFELWLNEDGLKSIVMKVDRITNITILYTIPEELANHFRQLAKQIEEYDNSK